MAKTKTSRLTFIAIIAAMYVVATALNPFSYGMIQLRFSEIILMIPFWDKKYIAPCLLGVAIANMFSPLGLLDIVAGLLIGVISYYVVRKVVKNHFVQAIVYAILCAIIVGGEIALVYNTPFLINAASIGLSQLIVCVASVFGLNKLQRMKLIGSEQ